MNEQPLDEEVFKEAGYVFAKEWAEKLDKLWKEDE